MQKTKPQEPEVEPKKSKISGKALSLVRGFKDILPEEQPYWNFLRDIAQNFADGYGFGRIDLPTLEPLNLFVRGVGKTTDLVEKEMYSFTDQGGEVLALRPEGTASVARAYIGHGMLNLPQPVKLWYWAPMFRRERPQSGRLRQHYQFGCEIIGDQNPVIDAQLIAIARNFYRQIGLSDVSIQVNSIGNEDSRKAYKQELVAYYRSKRRMLCEDCKRRLTKNPLRLLDCKEEGCLPLRSEAPQIVDWLDEPSKEHFMRVIGYLDELDVSYVLNPYLVRGLDYYSHTVFEVWPNAETQGSQSSLCGGGRYDGLIDQLGGRPTPAAGFSLGIERAITQLKDENVKVSENPSPELFLAQIGDQAKVKAMILFEELRKHDIRVAESFARDSLKSQLALANKLGARYALILGQKEVIDGTILVREMDSGVQEVVNFAKIVDDVKRKLNPPAPSA